MTLDVIAPGISDRTMATASLQITPEKLEERR